MIKDVFNEHFKISENNNEVMTCKLNNHNMHRMQFIYFLEFSIPKK
jgi:hypothetical protein